MKILTICQYYYPERCAPAARLQETSRELVNLGHEVTVITGFPNYPSGVINPEYRGKKFMVEWIDGVRVIRTYVYATPNKGTIKRILNYSSFMLSAMFGAIKSGKVDVVYASSPPLSVGITGVFAKLIKRAPLVFEVRDLWPESPVALGVVKLPTASCGASNVKRLTSVEFLSCPAF
jgi:hypothetical protein